MKSIELQTVRGPAVREKKRGFLRQQMDPYIILHHRVEVDAARVRIQQLAIWLVVWLPFFIFPLILGLCHHPN